ncbi:hypothetical protein BS47DRAFT_784157 [Hydnum rufescens UP504]|uniref:Uncharacterized protein n=1 Tax=Hydnum rufescens UP504 TaxID=1448309 RepID=A0A9P6AE30_9AGAM|nr:hypothetical protein BS47DRAFT_784157 [Hydnum rufescens UP504]
MRSFVNRLVSAPASFTYDSKNMRFSAPAAGNTSSSSSPSDPTFPLVDTDFDITCDRRNYRPEGFPSVFGLIITLSPSITLASSSPHPRSSQSPYPSLHRPRLHHASVRTRLFFAFFDPFFVQHSFSISSEWLAAQRYPSSPSHAEYTRDCFAPVTRGYQFF